MDDFLIYFTLEVTVLTPTHIGSGDKLSNKAFILKGSHVAVIDEGKLIRWVSASALRADQFITFAENPNARLSDFLKTQNAEVADLIAYQIENKALGIPREIMTFIKQPNNQPYLPGSSLKGAIKSALLRGYALSGKPAGQSKRITQIIDVVQPIIVGKGKNPGNEAELPVFIPKEGVARGKRPNYDLLRVIGFADSQALASSKLQATEVRVLSSQTDRTLQFKTTSYGDKPMQLYAEMLQPGAVLRIPTSINLALLTGLGAAQELGFKARHRLIARFVDYCRAAADNLLEQEVAFYEMHRHSILAEQHRDLRAKLRDLPEESFLLPIGWGTGFDAKTITDQLGEKLFGQVVQNYRNTQRLGKPSGRDEWLGPALSPKSRKVAYCGENQLKPIGWIKVTVPGAK